MPLRLNTFNVVGEDHAESDKRRDLEIPFCAQKTGSPHYWTENKFLEEQGGEGADLMELRAAHATALVIKNFEGLCDEASRVGAITDGTAGAAVAAFVTVNVDGFEKYKTRTRNAWKPTQTPAVTKAVQDVYDKLEKVLDTYGKIMANTLVQGSVDQQLKATRLLANERAQVNALLPPVCVAVGADASSDAAALEQRIRHQRSAFMGLAAAWSKEKGVWKVGDGHIADLMSGAAKVGNRTAHFVTRADFNLEFNNWKRLNGYT